ncbi:MAG TPA: protein-L-isoaspartate O-methyltransferase [Candidatus Paceibacterota bacterium]|nr:protein-L-isoaspartate O-methyltransferase [Candidatus Paceibacterota bacterium]
MFYSNKDLIEELVDLGYLKSQPLIKAFDQIDRRDFVSEDMKDNSYFNQPLPIGFGQTISQPLTVAFMLELLDLKAGDKVLEIGAGSGWQTALIAKLIEHENGVQEDKDGRYGLVAIERILELKELAEKNISKYDFVEKGLVKILLGDGARGFEEEAPYDKIIAAATADVIPDAWKQQLIIGGRIVAPVKESIIVLDKIGKNEFEQKEFYGFSFVPLIKD